DPRPHARQRAVLAEPRLVLVVAQDHSITHKSVHWPRRTSKVLLWRDGAVPRTGWRRCMCAPLLEVPAWMPGFETRPMVVTWGIGDWTSGWPSCWRTCPNG